MLKKWLSITMFLVLMLTMIAGCSSPKEEEGSASADSYVEGEDRESSVVLGEREEEEEDRTTPVIGNSPNPSNKPDKGNKEEDGGKKEPEEPKPEDPQAV